MNYMSNMSPSSPEDGDDDVYLRPGDGFRLMGKMFVVQSRCSNPKGFIVSDPEAPGSEKPIASSYIKEMWLTHRLTFIAKDEHDLPIGVRQSLERTMRAFKEEEQAVMYKRLAYCEALEELAPDFGRSEVTIKPVCVSVALERQENPPSWTTLYQWWKNWTRAGKDVRALCPSTRRRGNRDRKLEPYMVDALEIGRKHWLNKGRPRKLTSYSKVLAHCVEFHGGADAVQAILDRDEAEGTETHLWPSYRTFCGLCADEDRAVMLVNRYGDQATRYEMYPVGQGPAADFPFHRVEADFKFLRIFVVDEKTRMPLGTPYLMAAIDCYSGIVAGFDIGFDPPSYVSAARCLKHIVQYKDLSRFPLDEAGEPVIKGRYPVNGVPHQFFIDNDVAFHAESFEKSAKALGCNIDYLPPATPYGKGKIERFWGTVQTTFFDMFPGKVLRIGEGKDVGYDAAKDAVMTLAELNFLLTAAIVDYHHQGIEPGTDRKRIDLWTEGVAINPPRPVRDHESLLELVGAYEVRRAERRGLALFGLFYNSHELALYRSGFEKDPMVEVRYDPQDISVVWVIDEDQGISFPVPCTRPHYVEGLSLHQHRVIRKHAALGAGKGRIHIKQLQLARAELFKLGQTLIKSKSASRTKKAVGRFLGVGKAVIDEISRPIVDSSVDEYVDFDVDDDDESENERARAAVAKVERSRALREANAGSTGLAPIGAAPAPDTSPAGEPSATENIPPDTGQVRLVRPPRKRGRDEE